LVFSGFTIFGFFSPDLAKLQSCLHFSGFFFSPSFFPHHGALHMAISGFQLAMPGAVA